MTVSRKDRTNMVRSPLARVAIAALFVWSAGAMAQSAAQDVAPPFANLPPVTAIPPITSIAKPVMKGEFRLYPSRLVKGPDEQWESYLGGPIVRNVINPTLRVMVPQPGKAN